MTSRVVVTFVLFSGITFPSGHMQHKLLLAIYSKASINPCEVSYIEAHGTGTKVGDPQEVNTLTEMFCQKGRKEPLLLGSVKSNIGHTEASAGRLFALIYCLNISYI